MNAEIARLLPQLASDHAPRDLSTCIAQRHLDDEGLTLVDVVNAISEATGRHVSATSFRAAYRESWWLVRTI